MINYSLFLIDAINKDSHVKISNHHKWIPYQNLGGKYVKNVLIDPQTTEIWSTGLNVTLSVSEGVSESVSDTLVREKLKRWKVLCVTS